MKNILKILLFTILLINFLSCERDYQKDEQFPEGSNFKLINTAGTVGLPLSVYYNGSKIVDQSLFNTQTNYFRVNNGSGTVIVNKVSGGEEVSALSINDTFEQNKQFTYLIYDNPATVGALSYLKVLDNTSVPPVNNVKIRMANFATNLGVNVDVVVDGVVILSNVGANTVSDFATIPNGKIVDVVKTGTTVKVKSLSAISFTSQKVYTLILNGDAAINGLPVLKLTAFSNAY